MHAAQEQRPSAAPTMAAQRCTEGRADDEDGGAHALPLCFFQDLLGVLASYPLHAAYALFFSRYLISLAAFFCPLLVSTSLLLAVLVYPEWTGVPHSLGRTCCVAVDGAGVELLVQICSFVLGSADGAGELSDMSELSDITSGSCFLWEEKSFLSGAQECCKLGVELPLQTLILSDHGKFGQIRCGIEDKMEEEDRVRDGSDAKRLEYDPAGSVEMKKCEQVRPACSSVSGRIRQWEAQVCRGFIQLPEDTPLESFSLEKPSLKEIAQLLLETKARGQKCSITIQAQEIPIVEESVQVQQQQGQELKQSDTKTCSEKCSQVEAEAEEVSASVAQPREEWIERNQDLQPGQELQEQERQDVQPGQDPQEQESDMCDDARVDSLKSTQIARCVHSRSTSENLVSEGSLRKEKEWKRTLACKLYEERMKLKVCREPADMGCCNDDMDMLWEAYEAAGSGDKAKDASTQEGENEEDEGSVDEGSVRQLCCLQALKFSTRKMNFSGHGKPSLAKISKVLRRMTALSRIRSGRRGL